MIKTLVISEEKENNEQHLIQMTMNVVNEEKDDTTDTTSVDKIEIPHECNHNIYNAFLIAYYRDDPKLKLKENDAIKVQIKYALGIFAYLTAISQCTALIFLIRVVMITSGVKIGEYFSDVFPNDVFNDGAKSDYTMFMWPFWFIAILACFKEVEETQFDLKILEQWNITSIMYIDDNNKKTYTFKWKNIQVFFLKSITEKFLGHVGSLVYFFVIAIYSSGDKWEGIINTIFNLLAYQFILDADEWAYSFVQPSIVRALAETSPQIDIEYFFSGHVKVNKIYMSKERKIKYFVGQQYMFFSMMTILYFSAVVQAFYSRNLWFFMIVPLSLLVIGIIWLPLQYRQYKNAKV